MKNDKENEEPNIIVDEDWKAQARAEKEKLAHQDQPQAEPAKDRPPLPPPSFTLLVLSLVAQARISLADMENPMTRKKDLDIEAAKHHIDMLEMLESKTKGNLSDDEKSLLDSVLYELRMRYVQLS